MHKIDIKSALHGLKEILRDLQNEDELERALQKTGLYEALGYTRIGRDIRGKRKQKEGIPDVLLVNEDESVQVVVELKAPHEDIQRYSDQLIRYANELRPSYALLTNGKAFWIFERRGTSWEERGRHGLEELLKDPSPLFPLRRQTLELQDPERVLKALKRSPEEQIPLEDPQGEGGRQFLAAFGLAKEGGEPARDVSELGPFGQLVYATYRLIGTLLPKSRFLEGAYDFWKKAYARKLQAEEVPKTWQVFGAQGEEPLYQLMFALESAYALTARLILARVVEDQGGESQRRKGNLPSLSEELSLRLQSAKYRLQGKIRPLAYIQAVREAFEVYEERFLASLYASDLFDWWREAPEEADEADKDEAGKDKKTTQDEITITQEFDRALGRVVLALYRFNFRSLRGDFLGELYQAYFDPETRKALGEFYTPPEVVRFILDEVGYRGEGRLLDPACGSGTFLVEALRRFLQRERARGTPPREILRKLTEDYALVGFDINPFAVMMAQVNLISHLVGIYLEALKQDPDLRLRHLPVVQTDSLRQELFEGTTPQKHAQVGLEFGEKEVRLQVPLPIKGKTPVAQIAFPNPKWAIGSGLVRNEGEWILALEALFEAVYHRNRAIERNLQPTPWSVLLRKALHGVGLKSLESELEPCAQEVWEVLEELRPQHGDGRFIKALTDFALGMVLKHVLRYDYVVGNPPYVRVQTLPEFQKEHWREMYTWVEGNFDIFIPFIERAFLSHKGGRPGWLEEGGRLGYITSNRFLNVNYAAKLRESLPKEARLLSLVDLGAATFQARKGDWTERPFREAMVYPAIFVWERSKPQECYRFRAARFLPKEIPLTLGEALERVRNGFNRLSPTTPHLSLEGCYGDVFLAQSNWLWPRGWYLMPPEERALWEKIDRVGWVPSLDPGIDSIPQNARRLANFTATKSGGFQGIATGKDEIFVLKQVREDSERNLLYLVPKGKESDPQAWENPVAIERDVLRPFLFGRDVDRWYLDWKGYWVVFPYWYGTVGNREGWHLIPYTGNLEHPNYADWPEGAPVLDRDYPHLWAYLKAHEDELRAREGGRYQKGRTDGWKWYDLAYPRSLEAATQTNKIVWQTAALRPEFALDTVGFLFAGSGTHNAYGLILGGKERPEILLVFANSSIGKFYIDRISSVFSGGYISYGDQFIKWLPIPKVNDEDREALSMLVQRLSETTKQIRKMDRFIERLPQSLLESYASQGKAPRRDKVANLAEIRGSLAKEIIGDKIIVEHDLEGKTLLRQGRGALAFSYAEHAKLVLTLLKLRGYVKQDELLAWEIPIEAKKADEWQIQIEVVEELRGYLKDELISLEESLDEVIARLYGISREGQNKLKKIQIKWEQPCEQALSKSERAREEEPSRPRRREPAGQQFLSQQFTSLIPVFSPGPNPLFVVYKCEVPGCPEEQRFPQVPEQVPRCPVHKKPMIMKDTEMN